MSLRKAAEMALETLEAHSVGKDHPEPITKTIQALRQALAQPEQEPVGYVTIENISSWAKVPSIKWFKKPTEGPLYTAPPKREWVGLTDEDLKPLCNQWKIMYGGYVDDFARAIEAKLKEKNNVL